MADETKRTTTESEALLKEIRENFDYAYRVWQPARDQYDTDMRYLTRGPWSDTDLAARTLADRPALVFDELGQFINQYVNEQRQNPRSVKLVPDGEGATDEIAELKQGIIRRAEEKSNARYARLLAAESAAIGGFGFYGLLNRYVNQHNNDQELYYRTFQNQRDILIDPDFLEPDASDMNYAFVPRTFREKEFKRKYPKAKITNFGDFAGLAPKWIKEDSIQVAEYWKVKKTNTTETIEGKEREVEHREVWQYMTNGIEILAELQWSKDIKHKDGKTRTHGIYIPIIPVFAKVLWVDGPGGGGRIFVSMIRMARDAYMTYCAARTNQAEFAGMIPKTHAVAYKGQIVGQDLVNWTNAHKLPVGVLFVEPTIDAASGQILPLPQRMQYDASPVAVMDGFAESARRAIQAAMGASPLPTSAQRRNEKSGIALERIEASQQRGWFHLADNVDMSVNLEGRIFNDYMPVIYDTPQELGIKNDDGSYELAKVNQPYSNKQGQQQAAMMLTEGGHDVTISTGPSYESQREEANAFVDTLIGNIAKLPIPPEVMGKLLSLAIRMKQLGALGDKMAEILSPDDKEEMPPQAKQAIQQMQQQLQSVDAFAKEMQGMVQKLTQEKVAKSMELDSKELIAAMNNETNLMLERMKISGDALIERLSAEFGALTGRLTAQQAEPEDEFAEAEQ